jgi:hypothetical protein
MIHRITEAEAESPFPSSSLDTSYLDLVDFLTLSSAESMAADLDETVADPNAQN